MAGEAPKQAVRVPAVGALQQSFFAVSMFTACSSSSLPLSRELRGWTRTSATPKSDTYTDTTETPLTFPCSLTARRSFKLLPLASSSSIIFARNCQLGAFDSYTLLCYIDILTSLTICFSLESSQVSALCAYVFGLVYLNAPDPT